jgi:hypothetical protein
VEDGADIGIGVIRRQIKLDGDALPPGIGVRRDQVAGDVASWILDLVVHKPDLPLYGNTAKVGFGLWQHVVLSFPLELLVLGLGAWLYTRTIKFAGAKGLYVFWGFVSFLAAMQVYANFGPPPTSPQAMAVMALAFYAVLALLAAWVERFAVVAAGR